MNTYFKRIALGICIFIGLCLYTSVFAVDYTSLTTIPGVSEKNKDLPSPQNLVLGIYTVAIGIGSILAVVMVIIGGIKYTVMESFGAKTDAKKQITSAFLGLVLLLGSYLILKTINKDLVNFNTTLPTSDGKALQGYIAEKEAIDAQIHDLRRSYAAADAKTKTAENEAQRLLAEKETLEARYSAITNKNLDEAKALEAQITTLNSQHQAKKAEAAALDNAAQKLRRDGLTLIYTNQVLTELSAGNVDAAKQAVQRMENTEQQKIQLLKNQNAPQEEIKKAEASQVYTVTTQTSKIDTAQALNELGKAMYQDINKVVEIKEKIKTDTEKALVLINQKDPSKSDLLQRESNDNIKKINDALLKRFNCPAGSTTVTKDAISSGFRCTSN
ncbi:MAG TPA: hypothetical protein PLB51_02030 [Candidatus Paceibacterota bacterium]|nr:hypothetical protein [Candidatus Paceibacterota bacterium]